jgi:chromosomal replication initiation ATPase DnaA
MQVRLSRTAFDNWLRPTTIVGFDADTATVAAANTFSASTLQARYARQVEDVLSEIVGRPIRVRFTVLNAEAEEAAARPARAQETAALAEAGRQALAELEKVSVLPGMKAVEARTLEE